MTLVTGTVQDLGYDGMEGTLWARPARFRSDGQVVYAPERKPYKVVDGVVSADLAPGPAVLELQVGSHARGTFEVVIPEEDTTLADLLDSVFPWEPDQISRFMAERVLAEQAREGAESAQAGAETAAGTATTAAQQTGQDRSHVDQVAALLDETYDQSQAGMALPPRLMESALNATYRTKRGAIHDTFTDVPDGQLPTVTDSGHTWKYRRGENAQVIDGALIVTGAQSAYCEVDAGDLIHRLGCEFTFDTEDGTRTATGGMAMMSWGDGGIADNDSGRRSRAHVTWNHAYFEVGIRTVEGGPIEVIATTNFVLAMDVRHRMEFYYTTDTFLAILPDGSTFSVTDPRLAGLHDDHACWQPLSLQPERYLTRVHEVWADAGPINADTPTDLLYRTLMVAGGDTRVPVLQNNQFIRAYTADGTASDILGITASGSLRLANTAAPTDRGWLSLSLGGALTFYYGATALATVTNGVLHHHGTVNVTQNLTIKSGSGSPEGVVTAITGAIYMNWATAQAGTDALWVKTGGGNTGWRQVGHPSGTTAQRPASPAVGVSYFDTTLGKPVWWNGTGWVDATGTAV